MTEYGYADPMDSPGTTLLKSRAYAQGVSDERQWAEVDAACGHRQGCLQHPLGLIGGRGDPRFDKKLKCQACQEALIWASKGHQGGLQACKRTHLWSRIKRFFRLV